jgi:signal transduction histidine kinase
MVSGEKAIRGELRFRFGFALVSLLFVVLVAVSLMLLSKANADYGRLGIERRAAEAAAALAPWFLGSPMDGPGRSGSSWRPLSASELEEGLPDVMEHVRGLGLWDPRSGYVITIGDSLPEPAQLLARSSDANIGAFGDLAVDAGGGTIYYLKAAPGMMRGRQGAPPVSALGPPGQGLPGKSGRQGMTGTPGRNLLVVKYDGSSLLPVTYLRQGLILGLGTLALLLFACFGWFFFRFERLRSKIEEQRALARLGAATRTLAHEIRNPLSIIIMQKSLLERELGEERRAALDSIGEEARRIESQLRNVREALGDGEGTGGPERMPRAFAFRGSPGTWLLALVGSFQKWKDRVVLLPPMDDARDRRLMPLIDGDSLRSILVNLVQNAIDALDGKGRESDGTDPIAASPVAPVVIGWNYRWGRLRLEVRDRGGGIPRALRRRVFEPFFTTKPEGSGVGLNLARELAGRAGGSLVYRFLPPAGSRFIVSLPCAKAPRGTP